MPLADKDPKTERLTLRVSPAQLERWRDASQSARRELLDWVRLQLDDAADRELGPSGKSKGSRGGR